MNKYRRNKIEENISNISNIANNIVDIESEMKKLIKYSKNPYVINLCYFLINNKYFKLNTEKYKANVNQTVGIASEYINNDNPSEIITNKEEYPFKLNNQQILKLFDKNNELFELFKDNKQSPFSDYDFLQGIDQHTQLNSDWTTTSAISLKIAAVVGISVPHFSVLLFATAFGAVTIASGGTVGLASAAYLFAHLCIRYAFDYYRKLKRDIKKTIIFCTKYTPFVGFDAYLSDINTIYHKIFYYKENKENKKDFFNQICGFKNDKDEHNFTEQNRLLILNLNKCLDKMEFSANKDIQMQSQTTLGPFISKFIETIELVLPYMFSSGKIPQRV